MNKKKEGLNSKKERPTLTERINAKLDIPPDILPGGTLVELRGRNSLNISGKTRILFYTPERIVLSVGKDVLSIVGRRLVCTAYHPHSITIDGYVINVGFEEEEND